MRPLANPTASGFHLEDRAIAAIAWPRSENVSGPPPAARKISWC
jgi:hypothetical protein